MNIRITWLIFIICLFLNTLWAADKDKPSRINKPLGITQGPIVPVNYKIHKIGTLWSRVSNFGKTGDDAYSGSIISQGEMDAIVKKTGGRRSLVKPPGCCRKNLPGAISREQL